jgi:hypothetical protein
MGRVCKFLELSSPDKRIFLKALLVVGLMRWGVSWFSCVRFRRMAKRVPLGAARPEAMDEGAWIRRVRWAVTAAGRFIPGARNCLVQALAVETILNPGGASCLRIGVAHAADNRLRAHAWVEKGSRILGENDRGGVYIPVPVFE